MKICFLAAMILFGLCAPAQADDVLPAAVRIEAHAPLTEMGTGTYRKFGFTVYHASLWTPDGTLNKQKPYALVLRYTRDLSKDTLVDTVWTICVTSMRPTT